MQLSGPRVAFYGTLMRGFGAQRALGIEGQLEFEGACRIPGVLWDLGPYPGLTQGLGEVSGELFHLDSSDTLLVLDEFEGEEYVRCEMQLLDPPQRAWVYVLCATPEGRPRVSTGCWRSHCAARAAGARSR